MASLNYSITKIETNSLTIRDLSFDKPVSDIRFSFNIKADIRVREDFAKGNENLRALISSSIRDDSGAERVEFDVSIFFRIEGLFEIAKIESDDTIAIPEDVESTIERISISVARGMLFSNLRGTPLHNAILPLLEINEMAGVIKKD